MPKRVFGFEDKGSIRAQKMVVKLCPPALREDNNQIMPEALRPLWWFWVFFFYFHSADDVGMEPGYIAAIVLCVVLAIGIIALIIVLYAYNQRWDKFTQ